MLNSSSAAKHLAAAIASLFVTAAQANQVAYKFSGQMNPANAAGATLRTQAGYATDGASIPFEATILFNQNTTPIINADFPGFVSHSYTNALASIKLVFGSDSFSSSRSFYEDVITNQISAWDEAQVAVRNALSPTGTDRFVFETNDFSDISIFPGPKSNIFNGFSRDIDFIVNGKAYTKLEFRLIETRLDLGGVNLLDTATIPDSLNLLELNPLLSGFRLDMQATYTGIGAPTLTSKATFRAHTFTLATTPVPEPNTGWMLLAGLLALVLRARARRHSVPSDGREGSPA